MDDRLGVRGRLEDRAKADKIAPQPHRVRQIAVVRDSEAAGGEIGLERLDIADRSFPRRRVADVPHRDVARQGADAVVVVTITLPTTHADVGSEMSHYATCDATGHRGKAVPA